MRKLAILLIISAVVMGIYDGGDITGAVVLAVLTMPVLFEKKERRRNVGAEKRIYD